MPKKKKRKPVPPCPDPLRYTLVNGKDGYYWRLNRGTIKPARLNAAFKKNVRNTKLVSPAAKRIVHRLMPFLYGLETGRLIANIAGSLRKAINQNERIDFTFLERFELQQEFPLNKILPGSWSVEQVNGEIKILIIVTPFTVKRKGNLLSDFFFEAILLYGDPTKENNLRIDSVESPLYSFTGTPETTCILSMLLPPKKRPWMVLLKVSCLEDKQLSIHPKHYGMRVIKVG